VWYTLKEYFLDFTSIAGVTVKPVNTIKQSAFTLSCVLNLVVKIKICIFNQLGDLLDNVFYTILPVQ